mgnify:FL=1|tara:strand:- start:368 stop:850 length:483 start_codon:yes stop_codon:yes gene_type:complete
MKLSYEENLKKDAECNYIDFDKLNAHHILRSCINNPNESNPVKNKGSINMSIQEGFSSDNASNGGGVSYIPKGSCHDGYEKDEKGECIQKWRGRHRDGNWQRGHFVDTIHDSKDNYKVCGENDFLGLDNGYIKCGEGKEEEREIIGFENGTIFSNNHSDF